MPPRSRITGWKDLPAERKADYRGFVAPYLTEIDNQRATKQVGQVARIEPVSPQQLGQILNVKPGFRVPELGHRP